MLMHLTVTFYIRVFSFCDSSFIPAQGEWQCYTCLDYINLYKYGLLCYELVVMLRSLVDGYYVPKEIITPIFSATSTVLISKII